MTSSNVHFKVGLFTVVGLILGAALIVNFSKGVGLFAKTYQIHLRAKSGGSVIPGAKVVMAGVPIGSVADVNLAEDGRSVIMNLVIYQRHQIRGDARFFIKQSGFMGDQFVSVTPTENALPPLKDGDEALCEEPFSLEETARSANQLIAEVQTTAETVNRIADRIDRVLLSEQATADARESVANIRRVSKGAAATVEEVHAMLRDNQPLLTTTLTNLVLLSDELRQASEGFNELIDANRQQFSEAIGHLTGSAEEVEGLLADVRAGQGIAGSLLYDESARTQFGTIVSNFTVLSSNLNRYGLLYKPKESSLRPKPRMGKRPIPRAVPSK